MNAAPMAPSFDVEADRSELTASFVDLYEESFAPMVRLQ
jgi:hypothetical protein